MESIGFLSHYGYSPAINVLESPPELLREDTGDVHVLLSETFDTRHLLKTLADSLHAGFAREHAVHFHVHERHAELLCRALLQLTIATDTQLTIRERMELFLDLYGNVMVREKAAQYLHEAEHELTTLITDDPKTSSVLAPLLHLDMKFKVRDEMEEVFASWKAKAAFDIEKHRDQRLRYSLKERYDARKNVVDWDFQFSLKKYAPLVKGQEYRDFRLTGVAFETRLGSYVKPNKTMGSYQEGRKKRSGDSCLVRGFWGDIVNSPYIPFGVEIWKEPEKTNFYKEFNYQKPYSATHVSQFHVQHYITKLETLQDYDYPFEIIK